MGTRGALLTAWSGIGARGACFQTTRWVGRRAAHLLTAWSLMGPRVLLLIACGRIG